MAHSNKRQAIEAGLPQTTDDKDEVGSRGTDDTLGTTFSESALPIHTVTVDHVPSGETKSIQVLLDEMRAGIIAEI